MHSCMLGAAHWMRTHVTQLPPFKLALGIHFNSPLQSNVGIMRVTPWALASFMDVLVIYYYLTDYPKS